MAQPLDIVVPESGTEPPSQRSVRRVVPGDHIVIVGGGPAGLTSAYLLATRGFRVDVLEGTDMVGGISQTARYKGYRFDIGGHRFFTKITPVQRLWEELLGDEFIDVPRLSRIHYGGKYFHYPLKAFNALAGLGIINAVRILLSYFKAKLYPTPVEDTFEQWVTNRFGRRLYEIFFKTYTEKVWGIPCTEIRAEWAAQRIQGLSLARAILSATALNKRSTDIKNADSHLQVSAAGSWTDVGSVSRPDHRARGVGAHAASGDRHRNARRRGGGRARDLAVRRGAA